MFDNAIYWTVLLFHNVSNARDEYHDGNDLSLVVPVADASDFGYDNTPSHKNKTVHYHLVFNLFIAIVNHLEFGNNCTSTSNHSNGFDTNAHEYEY